MIISHAKEAQYHFPCNIGDTVYLPNRDDEDAIIKHKIVELGVNAEIGMFFVIDDEDKDKHPIDYFGKEVFLSEEEAAAHYDKFLDGARKAMQFFGIKVGDKLYIPVGTMVGDGSMEYVTVTAVGSDEQGPYFKTSDREHPEKQRNEIGGYYCYTEDEAIELLESL